MNRFLDKFGYGKTLCGHTVEVRYVNHYKDGSIIIEGLIHDFNAPAKWDYVTGALISIVHTENSFMATRIAEFYPESFHLAPTSEGVLIPARAYDDTELKSWKDIQELWTQQVSKSDTDYIIKCECGSDAVGSTAHSTWCPKHL